MSILIDLAKQYLSNYDAVEEYDRQMRELYDRREEVRQRLSAIGTQLKDNGIGDNVVAVEGRGVCYPSWKSAVQVVEIIGAARTIGPDV